MFTMVDSEFYSKLEELKKQSAPVEPEEEQEEYDPALEKRIERLDRMFDRMNGFFDFAEDAVDMIGDGISALFGLDDDDDEEPEHKRFEIRSGGVDAKLTDEFFDELERKILYKLDPAYKELISNGIPVSPYSFKAEDEAFEKLPDAESGYDRDAVAKYYGELKKAAVEHWTE